MRIHSRCQADGLRRVLTHRFVRLIIDFPLSLKPVTETAAIERPFFLPELKRPRFDPAFSLVDHGDHRRPKKDRMATTMTTSPTM